MSEPGLGYIPSPIDDRDYKLVGDDNALFGASLPDVPSEFLDLIQYVDQVNDQKNTNSCVWQSIQQQHYIASEFHGMSDVLPLSVMFGYYHTRKRGGTEALDMGCFPRLAWQAAATMGFCKESLWPFNPKNINRPPSLDATSGAIDQQWIKGYYNIWGLKGRDAEVRAALSKGHPVVFGTVVDDAFKRYKYIKNPEPLKPPTGFGGRHMMCAVGYDQDGLWVVNSWGEDFGSADPLGNHAGGWFRMSWEWVRWHQASDWWAVDYPKKYASKVDIYED